CALLQCCLAERQHARARDAKENIGEKMFRAIPHPPRILYDPRCTENRPPPPFPIVGPNKPGRECIVQTVGFAPRTDLPIAEIELLARRWCDAVQVTHRYLRDS